MRLQRYQGNIASVVVSTFFQNEIFLNGVHLQQKIKGQDQLHLLKTVLLKVPRNIEKPAQVN